MKQAFANMIIICFGFSIAISSYAQESVFNGLKSDLKKANENYQNQVYDNAIILFERVIERSPDDMSSILKLANSYFFTNKMGNTVSWYKAFDKNNGRLTPGEELQYASALHACGYYSEAIIRLQNCQKYNPEDLEISKKIWQLQNVHFLMEDSIFYEIKGLTSNTEYDESGPVYYGNSLVFISNRDVVSLIKRTDASSGTPYFRWYVSELIRNKTNPSNDFILGKSTQFATEIKSKYHKGNLSFSQDEKTMTYALIKGGKKNAPITSKLYFAKKVGDKWEESTSFPFNNSAYSIAHPFLSDNGKRIYFSSDMPGGFGGTDLYYSDYINSTWTKPVNLGNEINTSQDEGHPFVFLSTLYFSSNGQPGLGGLDIFHVDLERKPYKIINHGYPVNTHHDDFSLILDDSGSEGYFCSNRDKHLNRGDDIYRIIYKKLSFPLVVSGIINFKRNDFIDDRPVIVKLSNASIELIDKESHKIVYESMTDLDGKFNIEIPYESRFLLKVRQYELGTAIVSMEIPKNHRDYLNHEIVIVQDLFNNTQEIEVQNDKR